MEKPTELFTIIDYQPIPSHKNTNDSEMSKSHHTNVQHQHPSHGMSSNPSSSHDNYLNKPVVSRHHSSNAHYSQGPAMVPNIIHHSQLMGYPQGPSNPNLVAGPSASTLNKQHYSGAVPNTTTNTNPNLMNIPQMSNAPSTAYTKYIPNNPSPYAPSPPPNYMQSNSQQIYHHPSVLHTNRYDPYLMPSQRTDLGQPPGGYKYSSMLNIPGYPLHLSNAQQQHGTGNRTREELAARLRRRIETREKTAQLMALQEASLFKVYDQFHQAKLDLDFALENELKKRGNPSVSRNSHLVASLADCCYKSVQAGEIEPVMDYSPEVGKAALRYQEKMQQLQKEYESIEQQQGVKEAQRLTTQCMDYFRAQDTLFNQGSSDPSLSELLSTMAYLQKERESVEALSILDATRLQLQAMQQQPPHPPSHQQQNRFVA